MQDGSASAGTANCVLVSKTATSASATTRAATSCCGRCPGPAAGPGHVDTLPGVRADRRGREHLQPAETLRCCRCRRTARRRWQRRCQPAARRGKLQGCNILGNRLALSGQWRQAAELHHRVPCRRARGLRNLVAAQGRSSDIDAHATLERLCRRPQRAPRRLRRAGHRKLERPGAGPCPAGGGGRSDGRGHSGAARFQPQAMSRPRPARSFGRALR